MGASYVLISPIIMLRVLLLCLALVHAAAFAPVAPARGSIVGAARSDAVVMGARKGKVNPALFATGINKKDDTKRGGGRKAFRNAEPKLKSGAWAGAITPAKPWVEAQKKANASVKFGLSAKLGSKERPGGGAGIFFLGGGRSGGK